MTASGAWKAKNKRRYGRLTYVIGAIAGLVFGGIIGLLKNLFIWRKYIDDKDGTAGQSGAATIYGRAMISYFANIAALAAAFFMRGIVPFDGIAFLIGTAAALAILNHMWMLKQKGGAGSKKEV